MGGEHRVDENPSRDCKNAEDLKTGHRQKVSSKNSLFDKEREKEIFFRREKEN